MEILKSVNLDKVSADADQAENLLRLLDSVVIKLEGGTEEDLQILNVKPSKLLIPKDISKEKEKESKTVVEKKPENRYCKHKIYSKVVYIMICAIIIFFCLFHFSEGKTDEKQQGEKESKNGESAGTQVQSLKKDENETCHSDKAKENDELKDAEETANDDKSRT